MQIARKTARRAQKAWTHALAQQALQEPLIESRLTLGALRAMRPGPRPRTVFVGIGLCSRTRLSVALPVDILGMLLPAERIREAIGASSLTVLVADRHALINGLDAGRVEQRARDTVRMLAGIRRALGMQQMRILRASHFHDTNEYRAMLARVERRAPAGEHAYVKRQIADCEYLHQRCEGIVKIGWSIDRAGRGGECLFDRRFQAWLGDHIGFVYCKAGRVLDERRRKAPPYLVVDPAKRVCLEPDEDVGAKLHRYAAGPVVHGVRKHLRALTYSACKQLGPIRGPLEYRVQQLIACVVARVDHASEGSVLRSC